MHVVGVLDVLWIVYDELYTIEIGGCRIDIVHYSFCVCRNVGPRSNYFPHLLSS
jgi:hypothetical protein